MALLSRGDGSGSSGSGVAPAGSRSAAAGSPCSPPRRSSGVGGSSSLRPRAVEAVAAERAARAPAEAAIGTLIELTGLMTRASLAAAGYHRHDRGPWRRRRVNGEPMRGATEGPGGAGSGGEPCPPLPGGVGDGSGAAVQDRSAATGGVGAELRSLIHRAETGDRAVLPALRALLEHNPALWEHCGDVARVARGLWGDLLAGRNLLIRESIELQLAAMRDGLASPSDSPLVRLAADALVATWLQLAQADAALAGLEGKGATTAQLGLMTRRQDQARRTHLGAIKALATIRKLAPAATPAVEAPVAVEPPATDRPERRELGGDDTSERSPARARRPRKPRGSEASSPREDSLPRPIRDRMRGFDEVAADN